MILHRYINRQLLTTTIVVTVVLMMVLVLAAPLALAIDVNEAPAGGDAPAA